jgi:DNA topoisomerase-3
MLQAAAVSVRMDLDLRVGAALTRFQTMSLQTRFAPLDSKILSYGPCQFPTLGFVVEQYERLQNFVAETFWYIDMRLERERQEVKFTWKRHRLFDEYAAFLLYEMCVVAPEATVTSVQTRPASKWLVV